MTTNQSPASTRSRILTENEFRTMPPFKRRILASTYFCEREPGVEFTRVEVYAYYLNSNFSYSKGENPPNEKEVLVALNEMVENGWMARSEGFGYCPTLTGQTLGRTVLGLAQKAKPAMLFYDVIPRDSNKYHHGLLAEGDGAYQFSMGF